MYIESVNNTLDETFNSPTVTINDELLGNEQGKENTSVTIKLKFEEIVTLDVNVDETNMGVIDTPVIETKHVDGETVAHTYADNKLTVFKNTTIDLSVQAIQDEENGKYYVVNKAVIGGDVKTINRPSYAISEQVNGLADSEGTAISISAARVYNADDRVIVTNITVNLTAEDTANNIPSGYINASKYIVEGAKVYYNIVENNSNYDFFGMKVGDRVIFKADLGETDWTYNDETKTRTWYQESFSEEISTAEPIMLERWYSADETNNREVKVEVSDGVSAYLDNVIYGKVGQTYTLRNNTFTTGNEALYAGTWQVRVEGLTANAYTIQVLVYKGEGEAVDYGTNPFEVDGSVTKIEILIQTV